MLLLFMVAMFFVVVLFVQAVALWIENGELRDKLDAKDAEIERLDDLLFDERMLRQVDRRD